MYFYFLHLEKVSDTSIILYGLSQDGDDRNNPFTVPLSITINEIISPILLEYKEDWFNELNNKSNTEKAKINKKKKTNIFNNKLPIKIEIIEAINVKVPKTMQGNFMHVEFISPIEQFMIQKRIKGPCIIEIEEISTTGDLKNYTLMEHIKFVKNGTLPNLCIASIAFKNIKNHVDTFCIYTDKTRIKGSTNPKYKETGDIKYFPTELEAFNFINETLDELKISILLYFNVHDEIISQIKTKGVMHCNVYAISQTLTKGRDFSIDELVKNLSIKPEKCLMVEEKESCYIYEIFKVLDILELSKQISEVCGCPLYKTLENCRAERIEYLLLHELYERNVIFPYHKSKDSTYEGGLVLPPDISFNENLVLLLDFNSLYPSIIQEFNVCFSTVGLPKGIAPGHKLINNNRPINNDGSAKFLKSNHSDKCGMENSENVESVSFKGTESGILPGVLANLVRRRRAIKELMRKASKQEQRALDIRQKAIKLTANSIYGCLGCSFSRFSNYPMASYITQKGRDLLREAVRIAQEDLSLKVIYGDTDSIMIDTKLKGINKNYSKAIECGERVKEAINSKFTNIEIEIECVFKKLLLYAKKKYGALIIDKNGNSIIEMKGLDFIRRDYACVSADITRIVFNVLLTDLEKEYLKFYTEEEYSGSMDEDTFITNNGNPILAQKIVNTVTKYKTVIRTLPKDKFLINTILKKNPDKYNMKSSFPAVSLALRLGLQKNDIVSYIIGKSEQKNALIGDRTYHINEKCKIDYEYYVSNQVLPSLTRILYIFDGINIKDIYNIFGVNKNTDVHQQKFTILSPCCSKIQDPSSTCMNCFEEISETFYIYKVHQLLRNEISKLYKVERECKDCNYKTLNYYEACISCNVTMNENIRNGYFNTFLEKLHTSFSNFEKVIEIISKAMEVSGYRTIQLGKYFEAECGLQN